MNKPLIDFHFDFETRSHVDLKKVGAVKYGAHPSTEATLLTWCFGRTGKVKAWRYGQPIPTELCDVLANPEKYNFIAWNIVFDFMIWSIPFSRQIKQANIKRPKIENLTDAMALSQHFRTGASLGAGAKMLNIPMSKDTEGRRLMLKQCKISKKTGDFPELTSDEWVAFERYGVIDTVILREAYYKLPPLPTSERWIFEWTIKRNLTGIKIDTDLVQIMDEIIKHNMPLLEREFAQITGGLKIKSTKAKDWFIQYFPWIKNMQAETVRDMQKRTDGVPPHALRALEIKAMAGSTSISKVACAVNMQLNGRIYDLFSYHMAQTKRFAGRGIQIHNFPRVNYDAPDKLPELNVPNLADFVRAAAPTLQDPIGYVKNLLRRIWVVEPGKQLYCGDFSKVEPTVLYWLTGMGPVPKLAYEEMAVEIYNKPLAEISSDSEERQIGKGAVLGGGYGMGWKKFIDQIYTQTGIRMEAEFSKHVIATYRKVNAPIPELWRNLQAAFRKAINGESTAMCDRKLFIMPMQAPFKGVQIRLPSGSFLYYHGATVEVDIEETEVVEVVNGQPVVKKYSRAVENLYYLADIGNSRIGRNKVYGGLLCEHVTSAAARDLLTHAMYQLDVAGFDVLSTVHDEIWGESHHGREDEFNRVMCILPYWAQDIEVTADLKCGVRYLK